MTQIWQIAACETGRNYTQLFLNHDVMFMGPGNPGPYEKGAYELLKKQCSVGKGITVQLRQFCTEVREEDIVLLRLGARAEAIGLIKKAEYFWTPTFDDVFGWDLQHTHRVVWQHDLTDALQQMQDKKSLFYYRGPTFSRVSKAVHEPLKGLFSRCRSRPLKTLPSPLPDPLTTDELGEQLFSKGLPNEAVDKVLVAIQRQRRLAKWYDIHGKKSERPKEHEVVAHMILPFLLALGWSEQLLAVEWHEIDLAAFWGTPTTKENCCVLCEAKGLGHGLQNIFTQATGYVEKYKLNNSRKIVLTDGTRLYLYQRLANGKWTEEPVGYLNVNIIRTNHIAPAGTNAVDTIMALTPAGISRVGMNMEL